MLHTILITSEERNLLGQIYWPTKRDMSPVHRLSWEQFIEKEGIWKTGDLFSLRFSEFYQRAKILYDVAGPDDGCSMFEWYRRERAFRKSIQQRWYIYLRGNHILSTAQKRFKELPQVVWQTQERVLSTIRHGNIGGLVGTIWLRSKSPAGTYYKVNNTRESFSIEEEDRWPRNSAKIVGLFVPLAVQAAVNGCLDDPGENWTVSVRINLPNNASKALRFVLEDTLLLQQRYGPHFFPQYCPAQIARVLWWGKAHATEVLEGLTGILTQRIENRQNRRTFMAWYTRRWSLTKFGIQEAQILLRKI